MRLIRNQQLRDLFGLDSRVNVIESLILRTQNRRFYIWAVLDSDGSINHYRKTVLSRTEKSILERVNKRMESPCKYFEIKSINEVTTMGGEVVRIHRPYTREDHAAWEKFLA